MVSQFITDEQWLKALRLAAPDLNLSDDKVTAARRRCEFAAWLLHTGYQTPPKAFGGDLALYALAGEHFLEGLCFLELCFERLNGVAEWKGYPLLNSISVPSDLVEKIERVCFVMRGIDDLLKDQDEQREPPNAKPELHMAVDALWRVWETLTNPATRTKNDFLAFAYLCLKATKCATQYAVQESFDRHVRPKLAKGG